MFSKIYQEIEHNSLKKRNEVKKMTVKTGISSDTPDRIIIDAGAVYLNYGLGNQRLLGATRGGNEFNLNRVTKNIEADGLKGAVKGMKRVTEVNPQITANLLELSVDNLIAAIAGAEQSDRASIDVEHISGAVKAEFDLAQNDVIENSERIYVKKTGDGALVLQNRSKKYSSRFVGANRVNNKGFDTGIGDWAQDAYYDAPVIDVGGYPGNCLKFTGKDTSTGKETFLSLPGSNGAVLTNLVIDEYYRLQIVMKKGTTWGGGIVTVACGGKTAGESIEITPTTDWVAYVIAFKATGTDATITLTAATPPVTADTIYLDSLELERVDYPTADEITAGQVGYVMKLDGGDKSAAGGDAKASIVFMANLAADQDIIVNYTYELAEPGDHTVITGGEIGDTDYIDNVAIVGNVSGKSKPVICMVKNALADTGFSLSTAPRDEAVPAIVFTGHYDPSDLDTEPWEVRWPNA